MAYYIKANHVSGQIIISAVDESIGYESIQATIALDCDTSITAKDNQDTLFLVSDNGEQYHLYFPIVKAFNNGVEQTIANLAALDAWASGHKSTACSAGGGGGGGELVGDTSPQLGGNLDLNFYDIVAEDVTIDAAGSAMTITLNDADDYSFSVNNSAGTQFSVSSAAGVKSSYIAGPLTILGNVIVSVGTVNGRDITADGAKLDSIETNADVTDEANVTTALSGATLSEIETPAPDDKVLIQDADDSDNLKYASFSAFGGGSASETTSFFNGTTLDPMTVTASSDGATVTLQVDDSMASGSSTLEFSDGEYTYTTPDTVTLTAGSDVSPTMNYVYILQSNKTLTVSTVGWPATEHVPIATVLVQSAASVQTDGFYKLHAWTDKVRKTNGQGGLSSINYWIRQQPATWIDGVAFSFTDGVGALDIATTSGTVLQANPHNYPAFDTGATSEVMVVNDPTTAYKRVGDLTLANIGTDLNGTTLGDSGTDFYNLVFWGVVSEEDEDCQLMVNLPDGAYNNNSGDKALDDDDRTAVYTIPPEFTGTGFLICRATINEAGGTYTVVGTEDLRGISPGIAAGSAGSGGGSEFADNVFRIQDEADVTKELAFDVGTNTPTGTIVTVTGPSADINLENLLRTVDTGAVTAIDMNSWVGNEYSYVTASTASSYTINNVIAGGSATIRIQESTAGGPAFSGSGLTITKKGDWATNYDTTNVNTIFLKAVTATLIEAYIASVDA